MSTSTSPQSAVSLTWWPPATATLLNALSVPKYYKLHDAFPIEGLRERIDRSRAGNAYLGYLAQQLSKWRGDTAAGRQELIDRFGFDTEYAYHAIRLGLQGHEFLSTGRITLPIPEPHRTRLSQLRIGGYTEALEWANEVEERLQTLVDQAGSATPAPLKPLLTELYRSWYG